nr:DUF6124 family protein [Pseudomonas marginalis]
MPVLLLWPVGQPAYSCHPNSVDCESWQLHLQRSFTMIKDSPNPPETLFTVRADLDTETLLANASQDLAAINDIAAHLAFEVNGAQRNIALGICRMLEGVQLLVDKALNTAYPVA